MAIPNNRQGHRYRGKVPVELESGYGVTRDFSVSGVYFETQLPFTVGQSIDFTIVFHDFPGNAGRMKCRGSIVRVEENGSKFGVATRFDSCSFGDAGR